MRCPSQTVVRALFQAPQRYGLHPCSHSTLFSSFLGGTLVPCPTVVKGFLKSPLTNPPLDRHYLGIDNLGLGNLWLRMKCFPGLWACWSCACSSTTRCMAMPLPSASINSPTTCSRWKKARFIRRCSECC